jgi:hypothetical protein
MYEISLLTESPRYRFYVDFILILFCRLHFNLKSHRCNILASSILYSSSNSALQQTLDNTQHEFQRSRESNEQQITGNYDSNSLHIFTYSVSCIICLQVAYNCDGTFWIACAKEKIFGEKSRRE